MWCSPAIRWPRATRSWSSSRATGATSKHPGPKRGACSRRPAWTDLTIDYNNRGVDQPYKVVGTWLIDQWAQIGVKAEQQVRPSPQFYAVLRNSKEFDVSIDFNCQSVINPIADVTKFLGSAGNNYAQYEDQVLEDIYAKLARAATVDEQRTLMREYERVALDEQAHLGVTLWWYKINPHRSYVKGWKVAPSHYLNQQLDNVWLDKSLM